MGWRFRKSVSIVRGVRINFGLRGFTSLSVGRKGATLNFGKRGTTGTVSVPGTGLSYQHRFGRLSKGSGATQASPPVPPTAPNPSNRFGRLTTGAPATQTRTPVPTTGPNPSSQLGRLLIGSPTAQASPSFAPAAPNPSSRRGPPVFLAAGVGLVVAIVAGYLALRAPDREPDSVGGMTSSVGAATHSADTPKTPPATAPPVITSAAAGQGSASVVPNTPDSGPIRAGSVVNATRTVTVTQTANVRAEPSMSGAVLRTVPQGTTLQVLQSENGWLYVTVHDGEPIGWVHSSLLK